MYLYMTYKKRLPTIGSEVFILGYGIKTFLSRIGNEYQAQCQSQNYQKSHRNLPRLILV